MKNILKYISLLFLGAAAVSCDFEDMPFDKYDSDFVFSNDKKAEGYVLGVYLGLPFDKSDENGYNRVDGAMLASASDEAMITVPGSSIVFLTDGSLTPEDAIAYSAKIIKDQISVFINFDERVSGDMRLGSSDGGEVNEHLFKSIDDLELSVRATNCLRSANIALVGELVQRSEGEMLKTKNFGRKSLDEIKSVLLDMGLDFGMKVDGFDKKYQEWKRKQQNEA